MTGQTIQQNAAVTWRQDLGRSWLFQSTTVVQPKVTFNGCSGCPRLALLALLGPRRPAKAVLLAEVLEFSQGCSSAGVPRQLQCSAASRGFVVKAAGQQV